MKTFSNLLIIFFALSSIFMAGCVKEGCTDPYAANHDFDVKKEDGSCVYPNLTLQFKHILDTVDLTLGQTYTINGSKVSISEFQYYLSGFKIRDLDAIAYRLNDVYLLVKASNSQYSAGDIRSGYAKSIHFNLGINPGANTLDTLEYVTHSSPLGIQTPSMWNPIGGYTFLKIEGKVDIDDDGTFDQDFVYDIGTDDLLREFNFTLQRQIINTEEELQLTVDLAKILNGISLSSNLNITAQNNPSLAKKLADNFAGAVSL